MLRDCREFGQFPRPGGWHEQDDLEMFSMKAAGRAQDVYSKKEWNADDADFVAWVEKNQIEE